MEENTTIQLPELWSDVNRKLDKKRLENSLTLSLPKFLDSYGSKMSKKDLEAFNVAVSDVLNSIQNGTVTGRTINRELVFSDGKARGTENERMHQAYGLAAKFVNSVIDAMPEYVEKKKKDDNKTKALMELAKQMQLANMAAATHTAPVEEETEEPEETNLTHTKPQYDPNDPLAKINASLEAKRLNKIKKLSNWNPDWKKVSVALPTSTFNLDQMMGAYKKRNMPDVASYFRNVYTPQFFRMLNTSLSPEKLLQGDIKIKNTFGQIVSAKQHIINNLDFLSLHPDFAGNNGEFNLTKSGKITIPGSFNEDDGTILLYDPRNKTLERDSIINYEDLFEFYKLKLGLVPQLQQLLPVQSNKQGGTLKYQYGGVTLAEYKNSYMSDKDLNAFVNSFLTDEEKKALAKAIQNALEQAQNNAIIKNTTPKKGRSAEQQVKMTTAFKDKPKLSGSDKARLALAAADLASLTAAYIPNGYAKAGSLILGAGSTLGNLGLDIADGENVWESLKTAGINLGMDFSGMFSPGSSKLSKALKTINKVAPAIMVYLTYENAGEELKSFKKLLTEPTSINANDLQNITNGISLVLGITNHYKGNKMKEKALVKDKVAVKTESGKYVVVNKKELSNPDLEKNIQKMAGFENDALLGTRAPKETGFSHPINTAQDIFGDPYRTLDVYDFSKVKDYNNILGKGWVYDKVVRKGWTPFTGERFKFTPYTEPKVKSNKKGGTIIKCLAGDKLGSLPDYDPTKYVANWGNTLYGVKPENTYEEGYKYELGGLGNIANRYKTDSRFLDFTNNGKAYAKSIESTNNYQDFTTNLLNSYDEYIKDPNKNGNPNNLFYKWAKMYDSQLPSGSKSSFFDENGNLRTSWTPTNRNSYNQAGKTYNNAREYLENLRTDLLLSIGHNDYIKEGIRYFRKDANGKEHWVDPSVVSNFKVTRDPVRSSIDGNTLWRDYELLEEGAEDPKIEGKDFKLGELDFKGKTDILEKIKEFNNSVDGIRLKSNLSEIARALFLKHKNLERLKLSNDFEPYHLEHPTYERQTTDMTNVLKSAYENGNESMARNNIPRYADASLNEAIKRETAADVRSKLMEAENKNAQYINQQREANDKIAMQNEQTRVETANKNRQLDYAAEEEKRLNTMKIHKANTDIDNTLWMKLNYDLEKKAQRAEDLQDKWNMQLIGSVETEAQKLLVESPEYKLIRLSILDLYNAGRQDSPEMSALIQQQADLLSKIKLQAQQNIVNRIQQIYGLKSFDFKGSNIYQPQIAKELLGGTIKTSTKVKIKDNESAKLKARSKDNDRFMKSVSKTVDSFLSLDKQLGKSLLHQLTLKMKI